jgi:hypothetical protein
MIWKGGRPIPDSYDDIVRILAILKAIDCPDMQLVAAISKWTAGHVDLPTLRQVLLENALPMGPHLGGPETPQPILEVPEVANRLRDDFERLGTIPDHPALRLVPLPPDSDFQADRDPDEEPS